MSYCHFASTRAGRCNCTFSACRPVHIFFCICFCCKIVSVNEINGDENEELLQLFRFVVSAAAVALNLADDNFIDAIRCCCHCYDTANVPSIRSFAPGEPALAG